MWLHYPWECPVCKTPQLHVAVFDKGARTIQCTNCFTLWRPVFASGGRIIEKTIIGEEE